MIHPKMFADYEGGKKRKSESVLDTEAPTAKKMKQTTLSFKSHESGVLVSQKIVDKLIMDFIIQEFQSISTVEKDSFKNIFKTLAPNCCVPSRRRAIELVRNS